MSATPEIGQLVAVRGRAFVVTDIQAQGLPAGKIGDGHSDHLVTIASVEDDSLGEEAQVIWELEPGATAHGRSSLPEPTGFDQPQVFDAFLDAVRWGAVSQADDKALQSPFRSGIEIDDYQLDPVVHALAMPRVNLLIADDVGLGKTLGACPTPRPFRFSMAICRSTSTTIRRMSSATSGSSMPIWLRKTKSQSTSISFGLCRAARPRGPSKSGGHQPHAAHRGHQLLDPVSQPHEKP